MRLDVVCATSQATPGGPYSYAYGRLVLSLPAGARARDGSTRPYRYRGYAAGGRLVAAANCRIPNIRSAVRHLDRLFGVEAGSGQGRSAGEPVLRSDDPNYERIYVYACRYGGEYPECDPPPLPPGTLAPPDSDECNYWEDCGGDYRDIGGGPSPEPEPSPETASPDDEILTDTIPNCALAQTAAWAGAYCRGSAPSGERLTRTLAAFDRMEGRGAECAAIAAEGRRLINTGKFRYFTPREGDTGGWGSRVVGVILPEYWVDVYATTVTGDNRNLDHSLTHEIEHTLGRSHIDEAGVETPNSRTCSGLT